MSQVMQGIRVLEVAQFTFVPAASAVLANWGADVIKIEHPVRGDTQRGFINSFGNAINPLRNGMIEHPNRGKRSVGIDISTEEGQALANDMLFEVEASDGDAPIKLVRNPVQFSHEPVTSTRAPQASEHTELFLMEMGLEWDRIEALKSAGVVA